MLPLHGGGLPQRTTEDVCGRFFGAANDSDTVPTAYTSSVHTLMSVFARITSNRRHLLHPLPPHQQQHTQTFTRLQASVAHIQPQ